VKLCRMMAGVGVLMVSEAPIPLPTK